MDVLDEELLRFWKALNKNNVLYIMVEGFATRFHGYYRNIDDLDMWLKDEWQNRKNLRAAFNELGYGDFASIETMQFIPGWTSFYAAGIELDIITEMIGVENLSFDDCYATAVRADLEASSFPFSTSTILSKTKKPLTALKTR
ncbi:hypothetical protein [Parafilimonas sp.]|uniref:hypothetical protein n=1 Tax=Parafilimonas sp. TaxID=1969739 RepID=UPI0039E69F21